MNFVNVCIEACVYTKFKLDLKNVDSANIASRQTIGSSTVCARTEQKIEEN